MKFFIEKNASILEVGDVENEIGTIFPNELESRVRRDIEGQYGKRFALRHPILTGIPTLGIAPAVSYRNAMGEIKKEFQSENQRVIDDFFMQIPEDLVVHK
jgi:hypothetical protein